MTHCDASESAQIRKFSRVNEQEKTLSPDITLLENKVLTPVHITEKHKRFWRQTPQNRSVMTTKLGAIYSTQSNYPAEASPLKA
jgi:hypothetical protein